MGFFFSLGTHAAVERYKEGPRNQADNTDLAPISVLQQAR